MTRLKLKPIAYLLLLVFVISQVFGGVVLNAAAQDATPTLPKPPYVEPEPVKENVKPGGQLLQGDSLDTSSESTLILSSGEASIHGLIYYDGYLWASTRTSPAKVIKINPASTPMAVVNSVTLATNRNDAEDIVAANGYIWTIASETDDLDFTGLTYLVRVDPATLAVQYTLLVEDAQNFLALGESLKYAHGKLWAGGYNFIAEIDITNPGTITFELHDYSALSNQDYVWATALTSDATHLWAIFGQGDFTPPSLTSSTIVRIDPANPASYVSTDISEVFPDDMFYTNSHLYTSSEVTGQPSTAYKIPDTLTPYTTQLAYNGGISYGVFFNPLDPYSFWGAFTSSPGKLIKFDLDLTNLWELSLPTSPSNFDNPSEIVFDGSGNMYVSTFTNPARIVRYTAPDAVTVSISKSGNNAVLTWNNGDALVERFEVWRSTDPYFTPQGTTPYATVTADVGTNTYTDVGALGDVNNNYFYVVRAFNDFGLLSPISNRVGEYDYVITPGVGASLKLSVVGLPLQISSVNSADDVAYYIDPTGSIKRIGKWDPITQTWINRTVGSPFPPVDYPVATGDALRIYANNLAPTILSWAGNLLQQGIVNYSLSSSKWNFITIPLDQDLSVIPTADALAADIQNGASTLGMRVGKWDPVTQTWIYRVVGSPFPPANYAVFLGQPYFILTNNQTPVSWP
jgi:hypothetical protein